ncbi:MAG TPA: TlyA family RNA methyltransferase [Chloroflexota bacterium]|nr:TlyA family RNA methyltransferase [Chloroflexota bacterium]
MRERLDVALVKRGLAETRERAHALILSGAVTVDGAAATRPAQSVLLEATVAVVERGPEYVSRGAFKLEKALDQWAIDPAGKVALDVGASTGGFTDLLLRRGAVRVYAVDVGYGQLHYKLRNDPRVISMERTNVRHLAELPQQPDLAVIDVSFISLRLALPPVFSLMRGEEIVALVKPQFEAGRGQVGKGGVVRDPSVHRQVLAELSEWSRNQPWRLADVVVSPITGPAGNVEFLSRWQRGGEPISRETIQRAVGEPADNATKAC